MKLKALILMSLLSTSAFAFEPPADQDCVEVQRECEPDAKQLDSNKWWYLAALAGKNLRYRWERFKRHRAN